jgi:O-antigen/teichoic acid export membrane protein
VAALERRQGGPGEPATAFRGAADTRRERVSAAARRRDIGGRRGQASPVGRSLVTENQLSVGRRGDLLTGDSLSIDRRMAKGAIWMILARVGDRAIGAVSTVVLVRLLLPSDFGLMAMASSILVLLELISSFGFDLALIQEREASRRHFDTAWTLLVLTRLTIGGAMVALAGPAARFYDEPRIGPVILLLALGTAVRGFENIGVVILKKELTFDRYFYYVLARKLMMLGVTLPLVFHLRSYWALAYGILAGEIGGMLLSYRVHPFRPRFSLAARRELLRFSKWLLISNFVGVMNQRAADFVVGKLSGAHALGTFGIAYETSLMGTNELVGPINAAVYPGYTVKAHDLSALRKSYLEVLGFTATVVVPAGLGMAAVAELLVPVIFGSRWREAVPLVIVLSVFGVLLAVKSNAHYVYLAVGRPRIAMQLGLLEAACLLPMLAMFSFWWGAFGAACAYLGAHILFTPISVSILRRTLGLSLADFSGALLRPVGAACAMYGLVRWVARSVGWDAEGGMGMALLACVTTGAVTYAICLFGLWRLGARPDGPERVTVDFVRAKLRAWL